MINKTNHKKDITREANGFKMPQYYPPDFSEAKYQEAPSVKTAVCDKAGVVPEQYHATSIYPEYYKIGGAWKLAEESRMDCVVVVRSDGTLDVVEPRNVSQGDIVVLGRTEDCEDGIYLHVSGFVDEKYHNTDQFAFRKGRSRETAFSIEYDNLYDLLNYERDNGYIVWVLGPAVSFDHDSRLAMQQLVENGFVHGLLAGNALATHDLEAGFMRTALGQDIYTQESQPNGHYNHLDTINAVRRSGSISKFIDEHNIPDGIMYALEKKRIPYVLTSSIRDDGPLPEVIHGAYDGQTAMRGLIKKATTLICLATQLHTIASGNMTPCFRVIDGIIRPLFIYSVDLSEFAINKLSDRGSLSAVGMVTNVQDFVVNTAKGVIRKQ